MGTAVPVLASTAPCLTDGLLPPTTGVLHRHEQPGAPHARVRAAAAGAGAGPGPALPAPARAPGLPAPRGRQDAAPGASSQIGIKGPRRPRDVSCVSVWWLTPPCLAPHTFPRAGLLAALRAGLPGRAQLPHPRALPPRHLPPAGGRDGRPGVTGARGRFLCRLTSILPAVLLRARCMIGDAQPPLKYVQSGSSSTKVTRNESLRLTPALCCLLFTPIYVHAMSHASPRLLATACRACPPSAGGGRRRPAPGARCPRT